MSLGLLGKKIGMTRVFSEDGTSIPVTVVDIADNVLVQRKTEEKDGYSAVQVGFDDKREARLNQPQNGHFKKHGASTKRIVKEFRFKSDEEVPEEHPGLKTFEEGQWVDVIGTTKGKGFQGVYRRFGFGGLPASHGSMMHRRPGGIGCGTTPGRVWKNAKMPGRMGNRRRTVQNLKVVSVREEDNVILISGAVPGAKGSCLVVRPAVKKPIESK